MDENNFWLRLVAILAGVVVVLIGGCTASTIHADRKIAQEVLAGVDPILARCAHYPNSSNDGLCAGRK